MRESTESFSQSIKDVSKATSDLGAGVCRSIEMLSRAFQQPQYTPPPVNNNMFYQQPVPPMPHHSASSQDFYASQMPQQQQQQQQMFYLAL